MLSRVDSIERVTTALVTVISMGMVLQLCTPWLLAVTMASPAGVTLPLGWPHLGEVLFWAIEASMVPAAPRIYRQLLADSIEMRRQMICWD